MSEDRSGQLWLLSGHCDASWVFLVVQSELDARDGFIMTHRCIRYGVESVTPAHDMVIEGELAVSSVWSRIA